METQRSNAVTLMRSVEVILRLNIGFFPHQETSVRHQTRVMTSESSSLHLKKALSRRLMAPITDTSC